MGGASVKKDRSIGDKVAESLAHGVLSGKYRPGDLLPKEVELSDQFGISRASVRSGLQSLAAYGIVRRLAGQGTIAQEFREWNILDPVVTGWLANHDTPHPEFVHSIFSFRYTTEPLIAAIAARQARARDLLSMEEAYEGMERCLKAADAEAQRAFTEFDVNFHVAIYRATHNAVWRQLAHILRPAITLVVSQSNGITEELRVSLNAHRKLMENVRLRDPAQAFDSAVVVMRKTAQELGIDYEIGIETDQATRNLLLNLFQAHEAGQHEVAEKKRRQGAQKETIV